MPASRRGWREQRTVTRVLEILRAVCPRCGRGHIFRGFFAMNRECPSCQLRFEREQGYFVGAMYFSYALAILAVLPVVLAMLMLGFSAGAIYLTAALTLLVLAPWLFRYSRVLWLYLDQVIDPR